MYFYRDLFASLCFIIFGAALAFKHPILYMAAMAFGALSRTAARKKWQDPEWFAGLLTRFGKRGGG